MPHDALFDNKYAFFRFLSTDGTTSGTKEMATTTDTYYFTATAPCIINRMIVSYEDETGAAVQEYGNMAALTSGHIIRLVDSNGTVIVNLTDDVTIKTNGDWIRHCFDYVFENHGSGDDYFGVRWTFSQAGKPLQMNIGDRFEFFVQDDLTNLVSHEAMIQGYYTV